MKNYYKINVTKQSVGTAIMHREPPLQGEIITKATDITSAGDFKLVVVECDDEQHRTNLSLAGVVSVSEADAEQLAPKFQPKRSIKEFDIQTGKSIKREVPAFDIKNFVKQYDKQLKARSLDKSAVSPEAGDTTAIGKKTVQRTKKAGPKKP